MSKTPRTERSIHVGAALLLVVTVCASSGCHDTERSRRARGPRTNASQRPPLQRVEALPAPRPTARALPSPPPTQSPTTPPSDQPSEPPAPTASTEGERTSPTRQLEALLTRLVPLCLSRTGATPAVGTLHAAADVHVTATGLVTRTQVRGLPSEAARCVERELEASQLPPPPDAPSRVSAQVAFAARPDTSPGAPAGPRSSP